LGFDSSKSLTSRGTLVPSDLHQARALSIALLPGFEYVEVFGGARVDQWVRLRISSVPFAKRIESRVEDGALADLGCLLGVGMRAVTKKTPGGRQRRQKR
jgi:hypothetical protein